MWFVSRSRWDEERASVLAICRPLNSNLSGRSLSRAGGFDAARGKAGALRGADEFPPLSQHQSTDRVDCGVSRPARALRSEQGYEPYEKIPLAAPFADGVYGRMFRYQAAILTRPVPCYEGRVRRYRRLPSRSRSKHHWFSWHFERSRQPSRMFQEEVGGDKRRNCCSGIQAVPRAVGFDGGCLKRRPPKVSAYGLSPG